MPGWVLMHEEMVDGFVKCFDIGETQTQKNEWFGYFSNVYTKI
jgi:hypothetical protein